MSHKKPKPKPDDAPPAVVPDETKPEPPPEIDLGDVVAERRPDDSGKAHRKRLALSALEHLRGVLEGTEVYDEPEEKAGSPKPTLNELMAAYRELAAAIRSGDTVAILKAAVKAFALLIAIESAGITGSEPDGVIPDGSADEAVNNVKSAKEEFSRVLERANQLGATRAADRRRLADAGVPGMGGVPASVSPGVAQAAIDLAVHALLWVRRPK